MLELNAETTSKEFKKGWKAAKKHAQLKTEPLEAENKKLKKDKRSAIGVGLGLLYRLGPKGLGVSVFSCERAKQKLEKLLNG